MQDSFYRNFLNDSDKIVNFIGAGGKTTLIQRLSRDCHSMGKKVLILSLYPFVAPLEAKILLSDDTSIINDQIKREFKKSSIIYAGKHLNKGTIENFSITELKKFLADVPADHIFIEADMVKGRSLSGYQHVPLSIFTNINRYINVLGADALSQIKNKNWLAHEDEFWKDKRVLTPLDIANWYKKNEFFMKLREKHKFSTFFINKVENIYIENLSIPLAKSLKLDGFERVIIGSVFNSNLHVIK